MYKKLYSLCMVLALAACQGGLFAQSGPTPTPFPESFKFSADLPFYSMFIQCEGTGEPTIILENTVDGNGWKLDISAKRFKGISRTCLVMRMNPSQETLDKPHTTLDQVKDLHEILAQAGVPGPYVMVGHLTGGYNILLYTERYPKDVAGLVCVDCYPAGIYQNFLKRLDAQNPDNTGAILEAHNEIEQTYATWDFWSENLDILASENQVVKVTTLGDRPFVVLVAGKWPHWGQIFGYIDDQTNLLFEESWTETIQQISTLSTRGRLELLPADNMTNIVDDKKVDEAVQEVVTAVRSED